MRLLAVLSLVLSLSAFAQRVVILEIDGDSKNKLREQIEDAVREAGSVQLVSLKEFKEVAARKKLKGSAAMTPAGVRRAAKSLKLDAAVGGALSGGNYAVLIYDRQGEQLWTKTLPVKRGVLSEDFASKLARAIAAAAEQGVSKPEAQDADEQPGIDLTQPEPDPTREPIVGTVGPADPNRDTDLDDPNRNRRDRIPVPFFRVGLAASTTWRNQCLRPGVTACGDYDALDPKPLGVIINFGSATPYVGFAATLDFDPLAALDVRWIQMIGVSASFAYGQSLTIIREQTPQGGSPEVQVRSDDVGYSAQLHWRIPFQMGLNAGLPNSWSEGSRLAERYAQQPVGYAGLRGGLMGRSFTIDPTVTTSLPSSQRAAFGAIGVDVSLPVLHALRVDGAFSYFFAPRPADEQIIGYGNLADSTGGAVSSGFSFEAGLSGDLWGPLGYLVHWKMMSFNDQYKGQGQKWTTCNDLQCHGVGEETFHSLTFGVTLAY